MSRKDNKYNTSFSLDLSRTDDQEVIFKMQNRDRTKYYSIPDYLRAAVLAFDDGGRVICSNDLKKEIAEVMAKELENGLDREMELIKVFVCDELIPLLEEKYFYD